MLPAPGTPPFPALAMVGHHEKDYPRNQVIRAALKAAGFQVIECHSTSPFPWRHFDLARQIFRERRRIQLLWVTEGGHRLVPLIRLWAMCLGLKVVFDPFLSRYNTRIEDRKLYSPHGLQAWICRWQDWTSTHAAHALVFDTQEHQQYFFSKYGLEKPFAVVPVGVDEKIFAPREPASVPSPYRKAEFQVLFYGTFIPLQGVEWIVKAAHLLRDRDIYFTFIGRGQTFASIQRRAEELGLTKAVFEPAITPEKLVPYLVHADLCLGIFGDSIKAANVVANKVVQAAAMGKPMVTRDSSALRRYFVDGESAALIPPASEQALADKILELMNAPATRLEMGKRARQVFERHFSQSALADTLREFLRGFLPLPHSETISIGVKP